MRGWLAAIAGLALACAESAPTPESAAPPEPAPAAAPLPRRPPPANLAFPPTGPVELHPGGGPLEGTLYQMRVEYEGRTEVAEDGTGARDPQILDEKTALEIDYREVPIAPPTPDKFASSLVLEALQRRTRLQPPGNESLLEIADDRLRVSKNDKVDTDLRGAQPKQDLTPRTLLGKSFAMVVDDADGSPEVVMVRGLPAAKKLLGTLPLREAIAYLQIGFPDHPVAPGDTWRAKRHLANPIGKLGLAVDLELRVLDFERNEEAPCAHVVVRAKSEGSNVQSEIGFAFEEVRYEVAGDIWFDLLTGEVAEARLEDVAAVSYHRTTGANPARIRMRYDGRSSLKRLAALPGSVRWADGTKRFSAVK